MSELAEGGGHQAGHAALLHASTDEFVVGALGFVNAGLDEDEPVLVSAPGPGIRFLRERMNGQAHRVDWADTATDGANPARIMPVLRAFADAHAGRPVRFLQELAWAARTSAEQREVIRHEALINLAFAAARVRGVPSRPVRLAEQVRYKLGGLDFESAVVNPLLAARRADIDPEDQERQGQIPGRLRRGQREVRYR